VGTESRAPAGAGPVSAAPVANGASSPSGTARVRGWLMRALAAVASGVLFGMMMLTAVDVVGRYVLNRPVAGAFEITEMMLAALIYCGLPLVSQRREHIVIDSFDHFMSRGVKRGLDMAAEVVCSASLFGLAWLVFRRAVRVLDYGDTTTVLKLPLAPVAYLMAAMLLATALIHLALILVPHRDDDGKSIV
jgi:TRAP-type C4-dicarboxylate transport system permease small subunit